MIIQVKYAPKVRVVIVAGADENGRIPIDSTIRLRCETDANPNEITYQWYVNDEMAPEATDIELVSVDISHFYLVSILDDEHFIRITFGFTAEMWIFTVIWKANRKFITKQKGLLSHFNANLFAFYLLSPRTISCPFIGNAKYNAKISKSCRKM